MRISILFFSILFFLSFSAHAQKLELLAEWMTGSFSSEEQSLSEPGFFHVTLDMTRLNKQDESIWFYVEQSMATRQQAPYRQRVYRVYQKGSTFVSEVYEIDQPERFVNAHKNDGLLLALASENLIKREGCAVHLLWNDDGYFAGGTKENDCKSSLQGASYATSEVRIHQDYLVSWDRGFDDNDQHVWGSRNGAYIFKKKK